MLRRITHHTRHNVVAYLAPLVVQDQLTEASGLGGDPRVDPPTVFANARCRIGGLTVVAFTICAMALGSSTATAAPTCPEGSTYNKATKHCETSAITYCPSGSNYDPATGLCTAPATYNCPDANGDPVTYNSSTGNCETPVCYAAGRGETGEYQGQVEGRPELAICQFEGDEGVPTTLTCPAGGTYALDPETGMCTAPADGSPECAVGTYDAQRDVCVAGVAQFACPQRYQYNAQTGKCQTTPTKATKPPSV